MAWRRHPASRRLRSANDATVPYPPDALLMAPARGKAPARSYLERPDGHPLDALCRARASPSW